jgi:cobalt-zinc-cadmium resistance protein CzcA
MLFALSMMYIFGVSANLMSLGAIDFGLIVDGAVIIVEATLYYLHTQKAPAVLSKSEMNESVNTAASGIMRSSIFGVIIILIVYLPILSLTGIEGKMFRPMAQTVSFALIGALLLSATYVPAISAWGLSKKISDQPSFADRIIKWLEGLYEPVLQFAFHWQKTVAFLTIAIFAGSMILFSRLGGEFIPTLDEGDVMMHGFLTPGSSLTQTLESHRLVQDKLIKAFPDEVEQVISKIGSAEIPTDPMAIETADNVILLKDKSGWTKAKTKDELVALLEEKAKEVPGMAFEFTQPIKMRFDEMMTGVRSDVAVKVFGENLDTLARAGDAIGSLISGINGIVDVKVEQVQGLPQIVVKYDYRQIARYGLHVRDVNEIVRIGFAGSSAGLIYEDEKRFDLVLRMDTALRKDIYDVRNLPITTHDGSLIPLSAVASVDFVPGAAQISREEGQRRIVVSANVRGTDVETAITQIQNTLDEKMQLPSGYYMKLGGQFENLEAAKARLSIAVPIALVLIFILLYFAFNSLKEGLLIFTAIPMSAIGGIIALWLRDMPFSISAGVGFIALFGVAVLNGIVLISYFNQLEKEGVTNVFERVRRGALVRLRPVLMTASVASLGFLPMALSHGAGAEVQRPLATVVIGGLVSSTLLTLVVLPVLYTLVFHRIRKNMAVILLIGLSMGAMNSQAQTLMSEEDAIRLVLESHPSAQAANLHIQEQEALKNATRVWAPTNLFNNISADPDLGAFGTNTLGFSQSFPKGKEVRANKAWSESLRAKAVSEKAYQAAELVKEVRVLYQHLSYLQKKRLVYQRLDSLHREAARISQARADAGDVSPIDARMAGNKSAQIRMELETISHETAFDQQILGQLLGLNVPVTPIVKAFEKEDFSLADTNRLEASPMSSLSRQEIQLAEAGLQKQKAQLAPGFEGGLNMQYLGNGALYPGYQLGLSVPLFRKGYKAQNESAQLAVEVARAKYDEVLLRQQMNLGHLLHELERYEVVIQYYQSEGKETAAALLTHATKNYALGETTYNWFLFEAEQALEIELNYLENLYGFNLASIEIKALLGE